METRDKCEVGCMVYHGGEIKHIKSCVFYPESLTEMNDIVRKEHKVLYRMQKIVHIMTKDCDDMSKGQMQSVIEILRENSKIALDYFESPLED